MYNCRERSKGSYKDFSVSRRKITYGVDSLLGEAVLIAAFLLSGEPVLVLGEVDPSVAAAFSISVAVILSENAIISKAHINKTI